MYALYPSLVVVSPLGCVKKPWLRTSTFFFQILWLDPNTSNELIRENLTIIQADQVWTGRFLWIMVSSRGPLSSIG